MNELFNMSELIMMGLILFSSFFIFLFNYRQDNKEKYNGHWPLILLDMVINMGMSITGYMLITVVFTNIPQLAAYESYRYPIGYLFGLTSNVSIPIVLKWFQQQITKKLNEAGKGK
jgi:cellobiose-specific phosphotransferase system component IIC